MTEEKFEDYIYIHKLYLRLIGIWPIQEDDALWKIYLHKFHFLVFCMFFWVLLLLPMIFDIYIVRDNGNAIFQNLCMTIHALSVCLKFTHVAANQTVFKELLKMMKDNFDNSVCDAAAEEEKQILFKHARFGRIITKTFLVCVYYFEILMFSVPMIIGRGSDPARKNRYPFCAWYYWDQTSDVMYAIGYLIQAIVGLGLGVSYNLGMDTFVFVAIWHSCAQLSILQVRLRNLGGTSNNSKKAIKELVENHNCQIRNVRKLNQLFSRLCFYQIGTSIVANCFSGFQLVVALNDSQINLTYILTYSGLVIANFLQILLFCWPGQELMEQALEVGMAAYQSYWTNLSPKSSKGILLIILRAQKPIMISAGGLYDMTLQNFTSIVKLNMSFLSVLRAMINN